MVSTAQMLVYLRVNRSSTKFLNFLPYKEKKEEHRKNEAKRREAKQKKVQLT